MANKGKNAGIKSLFIDRKDFNSEEEYNRKLIEEFEREEVELIVLAGYLRILSKDFVQKYRDGL